MAEEVTFVHIPKTGGSSFIGEKNINYAGHKNGNDALLIFPDTDILFAVLRNPMERFVSTYNYVRMPNSIWHKSGSNTEHPDFNTIIDRDLNYVVRRFFLSQVARKLGMKVSPYLTGLHWNKQHAYLLGARRVRFYVVSQARLNDGLSNLAQVLPAIPTTVGRSNVSVDKGSRLHWTSRLLLGVIYYRDFILYKKLKSSSSGWMRV